MNFEQTTTASLRGLSFEHVTTGIDGLRAHDDVTWPLWVDIGAPFVIIVIFIAVQVLVFVFPNESPKDAEETSMSTLTPFVDAPTGSESDKTATNTEERKNYGALL